MRHETPNMIGETKVRRPFAEEQERPSLYTGEGQSVVALGLWERVCCPKTALAALEEEFGSGAGAYIGDNKPSWVEIRRWFRKHKRRIGNGPDGQYRYVRR